MTDTMRRIRGYHEATLGRKARVQFQASRLKPLVSGATRARNRKKESK